MRFGNLFFPMLMMLGGASLVMSPSDSWLSFLFAIFGAGVATVGLMVIVDEVRDTAPQYKIVLKDKDETLD